MYLFRGSELTLEKGWGLQMPISIENRPPCQTLKTERKFFVAEVLGKKKVTQ